MNNNCYFIKQEIKSNAMFRLEKCSNIRRPFILQCMCSPRPYSLWSDDDGATLTVMIGLGYGFDFAVQPCLIRHPILDYIMISMMGIHIPPDLFFSIGSVAMM